MPFLTLTHNLDSLAPSFKKAAQKFPDVIADGTGRIAKGMEGDLQDSVRTWSHDVVFYVKPRRQGAIVSWAIGTYDEAFGYVNDGTRAHEITIKRAPFLVFQAGYRAKTRPGRIQSVQGGPHGVTVRAITVQHPGFPARNILKQVVNKWTTKSPRIMRATLRRAGALWARVSRPRPV
jgi:hypothetical protein